MDRCAIKIVKFVRLWHALFFDENDAPQQMATGQIFGLSDDKGHAK
jgi:hypothetical protein